MNALLGKSLTGLLQQNLLFAIAVISLALFFTVGSIVGLGLWALSFLSFAALELKQLFRRDHHTVYKLSFPLLIIFTFAVAAPINDFQSNVFNLVPWISLVLVLFLLLVSRELFSQWNKAQRYFSGLTELPPPPFLTTPVKVHVSVTLMTPVSLMILAFTGLHGWIFIGPLTVFFITTVLMYVSTRKRRKQTKKIDEELPDTLAKFAPKFVLYWSARQGTLYQLNMWVPHLKAIGLPFIILVRDQQTFSEAVEASDGVPVFLARTLGDIETYLPDSISTVFYVNNAAKNVHIARFANLTHIQLLHGDSEKKSSYNQVINMYDRIYVAGQAAIDRYAENGVSVASEKFAIVGRPQAIRLVKDLRPLSERTINTILYAPTWKGDYADTAYSSLPNFEAVLERLIDAGKRIIFHPHPYCLNDSELAASVKRIDARISAHRKETGTNHLTSNEANTLTLFGSFNESDAMIADISGVVTDYLYTEKPLIVLVQRGENAVGDEFTSSGTFLINTHDPNLSEKVVTRFEQKHVSIETPELREYYLGNVYDDDAQKKFVEIARQDIQN